MTVATITTARVASTLAGALIAGITSYFVVMYQNRKR